MKDYDFFNCENYGKEPLIIKVHHEIIKIIVLFVLLHWNSNTPEF